MLPLLVLSLLAALWAYSWARGHYWRRRGVPHEHSLPLLGSRARFYFLQENVFEYAERIYLKYRGARAVGLDSGARRELLIRDPVLAQHVFITDFNSYADRGLNNLPTEQMEPLRRNILTVDGAQWRWLRQVLSPSFTPARVRAMFPLVSERAERLRLRVAGLAAVPTDACVLMANYTVDFISACGFGLDPNSIANEDSILNKLASKIFRYHFLETVIVLFKEMFPGRTKKLKYLARVEQDIFAMVNSIQKNRDYKPSGRKDFMDALLTIRQRQMQEKIVEDVLVMDDELVAAQAFLFFAAGYETSATSTSYTLHLLAQHPEAQERARAEVDATLVRHNGVITYEAAKEMTYLTWALKESMRLFPPAGNIVRQVSRPCELPGVGPLEPGMRIIVPVRAFHRDPCYFPDPDKFRPERFRPDSITSEAKLAYLPFGVGPRSCIGEKLAMVVSVAGLASVLAEARVAPLPGAPAPRIHPRAYLLQNVLDGLPLLFYSRTKHHQEAV